MRMRFVWVGKTKDRRIAELESEYLRRISHYYACDVAVARPARGGSAAECLAKEGDEINKRVGPGAYTVLLDSGGDMMDTAGFARWIGSLGDGRTREVVFVVGGHLGIDPRLLASARRSLSLSKMTFTHELCRVLLLEQIYRACTILNGIPYHK
ncbi:MAG: 23S rRNA (pseudouridine(1915)-N(3))-methyltransferase RlmH [Acidobacteriota bacterium]